MTGKITSQNMVAPQWDSVIKDAKEYGVLKGKKEEIGKLIIETQAEQAKVREDLKECKTNIKVTQAKIETSQKIQAKAKEELLKAEEMKIFVSDTRAKIKESNAKMLGDSKTGLNKMEIALKKMPGSESLLERAKELIKEADTLTESNANDGNVSVAFQTLQGNIKQLALDAQALIKLNKANAAAKK